jgi:hypothetical protein
MDKLMDSARRGRITPIFQPFAGVAELADARDSKANPKSTKRCKLFTIQPTTAMGETPQQRTTTQIGHKIGHSNWNPIRNQITLLSAVGLEQTDPRLRRQTVTTRDMCFQWA